MDDLNKQQLILLALLVSFVASVATAVATVSLVEQAPPGAVRVINRVVERTVERVVPSDTSAPTIVKEETVVVREDELITESIATARKSTVSLYDKSDDSFAGLGFAVGDGLVATGVRDVDAPERRQYRVVFPNGETANGTVASLDAARGVALVKLSPAERGDGVPSIPALALGDSTTLQLGGSVLALGGVNAEEVALGIVSKLELGVATDGAPAPTLAIHTSLSAGSLSAGSPLLNLFGEVIGVLPAAGAPSFLPVSVVKTALASS